MAYERRISDWSSDVCSSDLLDLATRKAKMPRKDFIRSWEGNQTNLEWVDDVLKRKQKWSSGLREVKDQIIAHQEATIAIEKMMRVDLVDIKDISRTMAYGEARSEEHKSELQTLIRTSYAVF